MNGCSLSYPLLQLKFITSMESRGTEVEPEAMTGCEEDAVPGSPHGDMQSDDTSAPMSIVRQNPPPSASRFRPPEGQQHSGPAATAEGWGGLLSFLTNQDPSVVASCQKTRGVMRR